MTSPPVGCSTDSIIRKSYRESETCPGENAQAVILEGGEVNVTADIEVATTPVIYNLPAPVSGTEYSQALTIKTKQFLIRVRGNADLQLAFTSGESGIKFITIPRGASYKESSLDLSSVTLYFQVNKASQVVEILEWS